jgi:xanthine/CO dehydrogenase XdhC/CoxF family maturation factor
MIHEFRELLNAYINANQEGIKCVLASVVRLEGSSYRRPGVRMLILENGKSFGAVSGGCVEKEVIRQAKSVFKSGKAKYMVYDGRYRLGCEGQLYLLLEPMNLDVDHAQNLIDQIDSGTGLDLQTTYNTTLGEQPNAGSQILLNNQRISISSNPIEGDQIFDQYYKPLFKLLIIGVEHDAVSLSLCASNLGWQVSILAPPNESNELSYFTGAYRMLSPIYEKLRSEDFKDYNAVVLMTHSFNKDIKYLLGLEGIQPEYFGILGPARRKNKVIDQLLEMNPDIDLDYIEQLKGPVGLDLGAETPQEIAMSICSEILMKTRSKNAQSLSEKKNRIHD